MLSTRTFKCTLLMMATVVYGCVATMAQTFTISGRLKIEEGSVEGSRVVVFKDGKKERTVSSGLSRFALELDLNSNYVLSFEKDGFVSKKLAFDTHAPAEAAANGFTPFEYAVSLFKQYDDVNVVVFNQPVGMIRYEPDADDFDYDTDYTKSIQSQLELIQQQVEEKQAQEAAMYEASAQAAAEAEKNKAKAEADAARSAAATAKEKERLERDQAEAAKRAEAEKAKAEALTAKTATEKEKADAAAALKAETERKRAEAAEAAQAEIDRKKTEALAKEEERNRKPAPVAKVAEEKPKKAAPPPPKRNELAAGLHEGEDARRSVGVNEMSEEPRIAPALPNTKEESPVVAEAIEPKVNRKEELIVEPNQVVTVIKLWTDAQKAEYKKIVHKYGAVFYFKNGQACSKELYQQEALATN